MQLRKKQLEEIRAQKIKLLNEASDLRLKNLKTQQKKMELDANKEARELERNYRFKELKDLLDLYEIESERLKLEDEMDKERQAMEEEKTLEEVLQEEALDTTYGTNSEFKDEIEDSEYTS